MKLTIAAETLAILRDVFIPRLLLADKHQHELDEAINLGISALKTIEDGNFMLKTHLNSVYGKMCYKDTDSAGKIDLKTLYEQTTMYCERIDTFLSSDNKYYVEVYQQPDTPIHIFIYWTRHGMTKIHSIAYTIKEN